AASLTIPLATRHLGSSDRATIVEPVPKEGQAREPFLFRIAVLTVLCTAAFLVLDFFFKWTLARSISPDRIPRFVAHYYAVLNGGAVVFQLVIGRALVRRLGAAHAILLTPALLVGGAIVTWILGGARVAVLGLKGIDVSLRNATHRVTLELLYLPLSPR